MGALSLDDIPRGRVQHPVERILVRRQRHPLAALGLADDLGAFPHTLGGQGSVRAEKSRAVANFSSDPIPLGSPIGPGTLVMRELVT